MALIILLSLFVGYRGFFGKKDAGSSDAGGGLDAVQLEKTLQRILENQSKSNAATHADSATEHADLDHSHDKPAAASGGGSESAAEVAQLKAAVAESRKKAEALQAKVKEAEEKAAAAIAAASAGSAAPAATDGMSEQEKEDFAAKIRDLEARLAEYEIISEDIADLSRYREENDELRKELDNVKSIQAAAPAPVAPAPVQAAPPPPAPAPEPEVPVAAAPPPEESPNSDLIDDELMREFAAAVEGQQSKTLEKVVEKAGDGSAEAKDTGDDATKLMTEFENFVAKKS